MAVLGKWGLEERGETFCSGLIATVSKMQKHTKKLIFLIRLNDLLARTRIKVSKLW